MIKVLGNLKRTKGNPDDQEGRTSRRTVPKGQILQIHVNEIAMQDEDILIF